jgi:hypothetical protein
MNKNAVPLGNIVCARWSGEFEPKPAIIEDLIPVQLTRDQLEDSLVAALDQIAQLSKDLTETRHSHANFMRRIKAAMGYKNWPELPGDFLDAVADLVESRLAAKKMTSKTMDT